MPQFVLDNSITMAWYFEDEVTPFTDSILDALSTDSEAIVPSLWPLEVTNVLLVGERRSRTSILQENEFLALLRRLPIAVLPTPQDRVFNNILDLARSQRLSSYDASYLDLAHREGLSLATMDKGLRKAATRLGVPLVAEH